METTVKNKEKKKRSIQFGYLEWKNKHGKSIPLYKMQRSHLNSVKKFLLKCKQEIFNNIHKSTWLIEIDKVLEWRNQRHKKKIEREISQLEREISQAIKENN